MEPLLPRNWGMLVGSVWISAPAPLVQKNYSNYTKLYSHKQVHLFVNNFKKQVEIFYWTTLEYFRIQMAPLFKSSEL